MFPTPKEKKLRTKPCFIGLKKMNFIFLLFYLKFVTLAGKIVSIVKTVAQE
jgi:hypothetical protein